MRSPLTTREYSDAGTKTCEGYPGSLGYEAIDAATWQSWGIDCEPLHVFRSSESYAMNRSKIW
jgi:hypothetical protein